jgi:hypothetical protein
MYTNGNAKWTVDSRREWDLSEWTGSGTKLREHIMPYTNASNVRVCFKDTTYTNAEIGYVYTYWTNGVSAMSETKYVSGVSSNWTDITIDHIRSISACLADNESGKIVWQLYTTNDMVFSDVFRTMHTPNAIKNALNERYAVLTTPPYRYALDEILFNVQSTNGYKWTATGFEYSTNFTGNLYTDLIAAAATNVSVVYDSAIAPAGGRIAVSWYSNNVNSNVWRAFCTVEAYGRSNPFYTFSSFSSPDELASRSTNWALRAGHTNAEYDTWARYMPVSTSTVFNIFDDTLACPSNYFARVAAATAETWTNGTRYTAFPGGTDTFPTDHFPDILGSLDDWDGTSATNNGATNLGYRIETRVMVTPDYIWK